jgi:hypothetical protein
MTADVDNAAEREAVHAAIASVVDFVAAHEDAHPAAVRAAQNLAAAADQVRQARAAGDATAHAAAFAELLRAGLVFHGVLEVSGLIEADERGGKFDA